MLCYFRTRSTELEGQTRKRYTLHCFLLPAPILTAQNGVSGRFGGSWSPSCRKKRALPKCSLVSPLLSMVLNAVPKSIPIPCPQTLEYFSVCHLTLFHGMPDTHIPCTLNFSTYTGQAPQKHLLSPQTRLKAPDAPFSPLPPFPAPRSVEVGASLVCWLKCCPSFSPIWGVHKGLLS